MVYVYDVFRQAWTGPFTYYAAAAADDAGALDTSLVKSISHIPTGITNITRLAVHPRGEWIAVVADGT